MQAWTRIAAFIFIAMIVVAFGIGGITPDNEAAVTLISFWLLVTLPAGLLVSAMGAFQAYRRGSGRFPALIMVLVFALPTVTLTALFVVWG